jgi:hypothetical protein
MKSQVKAEGRRKEVKKVKKVKERSSAEGRHIRARAGHGKEKSINIINIVSITNLYLVKKDDKMQGDSY